jgi:hypothetical protein
VHTAIAAARFARFRGKRHMRSPGSGAPVLALDAFRLRRPCLRKKVRLASTPIGTAHDLLLKEK